MPRIVSAAERSRAISLMLQKDEQGNHLYSQYDIEGETGLSRPYIRKIARQVGFQPERNGIEKLGCLCMCVNCSVLFRKPPSRVKRAKNQFCSEQCRIDWAKGENHAAWIDGRSVSSFSTWVKNQSDYLWFKKEALRIAGNKCQITGRTDNLDVHHIFPKAKYQDMALDPNNALVVCEDVHNRIHALIREGKGYEEAIEVVKEEFAGV